MSSQTLAVALQALSEGCYSIVREVVRGLRPHDFHALCRVTSTTISRQTRLLLSKFLDFACEECGGDTKHTYHLNSNAAKRKIGCIESRYSKCTLFDSRVDNFAACCKEVSKDAKEEQCSCQVKHFPAAKKWLCRDCFLDAVEASIQQHDAEGCAGCSTENNKNILYPGSTVKQTCKWCGGEAQGVCPLVFPADATDTPALPDPDV